MSAVTMKAGSVQMTTRRVTTKLSSLRCSGASRRRQQQQSRPRLLESKGKGSVACASSSEIEDRVFSDDDSSSSSRRGKGEGKGKGQGSETERVESLRSELEASLDETSEGLRERVSTLEVATREAVALESSFDIDAEALEASSAATAEVVDTRGDQGSGEGAEDNDTAMKWTFKTVGSIALVNLAAALFGSNQVLIKLTETEISPSTLNFVRFGIAALAFLPFGIKTGAWGKKKLKSAALELGTYLFVGYTAQVLGLGITSASRGAVMAEFSVLVVPLWARLSGQKIPKIVWYAATLALFGVALVTESDGGSGFNHGDALCFLSAICFGTHVFRTEQRTATMDNKDLPGLISLELALLTVFSGVYELVDLSMHNTEGLMALNPQQVMYHLEHLPWLNLVAMGMGTTALTLFIEINALQNISSTLASLIYTTEPLWGSFFAVVFLKEHFSNLGYLGAFLIVGSTAYATVKGGVVKQTEKVAHTD
mmetsp:Transcript_1412/g.4557  ORF Transcript_1412/g.4557 Transcript_1412/m.4557 type:complete len:484 (-) Transcript_1412:102-1553(-)